MKYLPPMVTSLTVSLVTMGTTEYLRSASLRQHCVYTRLLSSALSGMGVSGPFDLPNTESASDTTCTTPTTDSHGVSAQRGGGAWAVPWPVVLKLLLLLLPTLSMICWLHMSSYSAHVSIEADVSWPASTNVLI